MKTHLTPDEIAALALGCADPRKAKVWESHLQTCTACREALQRDEATLRRIARHEVPEATPGEWRHFIDNALKSAAPRRAPT